MVLEGINDVYINTSLLQNGVYMYSISDGSQELTKTINCKSLKSKSRKSGFFFLKFKLTILGSGGAIPTIEKRPTSQFLNIQERRFLIDCGEGTQIQLRKFGCRFTKIDHIFISHLHGDHYLGLIGLLSTFNLLGRINPIYIYAPKELKEILEMHFKISGKPFRFNIEFHPLNFKNKALIFEDTVLQVFSFPVSHSVPCCGFLFKEVKKSRNIIKTKIQNKSIPFEN